MHRSLVSTSRFEPATGAWQFNPDGALEHRDCARPSAASLALSEVDEQSAKISALRSVQLTRVARSYGQDLAVRSLARV